MPSSSRKYERSFDCAQDDTALARFCRRAAAERHTRYPDKAFAYKEQQANLSPEAA
jgi:hypothetical protein